MSSQTPISPRIPVVIPAEAGIQSSGARTSAPAGGTNESHGYHGTWGLAERRVRYCLGVLFLCCGLTCAAQAEPTPLEPTRYAASASLGTTYDPVGDIEFVLASAVALFDYDAVWPHRAPEALRFKVEATAGATTSPATRTIASVNMFAFYYLEGLSSGAWTPYAEAGVGLIYTDYRVEGQGLRFNFNPQAGLGLEYRPASGPPWFAALRLHHISNGNLHPENRGVNGVLFTAGRYFP